MLPAGIGEHCDFCLGITFMGKKHVYITCLSCYEALLLSLCARIGINSLFSRRPEPQRENKAGR